MTKPRCTWCGSDPLYVAYHDTEWGVPDYDGHSLWGKLLLESFQAGLSWITILKKRENFRAAFADLDPVQVAQFTEHDVERLVHDAGIIRHRGKIEAAIAGARAWIEVENREGFSQFLWSFVDGIPIQNTPLPLPTQTPVSVAMSKALRKEGFKFVGPTITYAFMQATGMVNDHDPACFRHADLSPTR